MARTKKDRSKNNKKKKPASKGAKIFFMLLGLVLAVVLLTLFVDKLTDAINKSKTAIVAINMQLGDSADVKFQEPKDVAVDAENNFYVTDFGMNNIRKFDPAGKLLLTIGQKGVHAGDDVKKGAGEFNQPSGLWIGANGDIYVADTFNHRIQVFDKKGKSLQIWEHSFFGPRDVVGDNNGHFFVVDTGNHKIEVFDENGNFLKEFGSHGTSEGKFDEPVGCAIDSKGNVYISDSNNNRIEKFDNNGKFLSAFKVSTWQGKNKEVPYIAIYQDNIYASNASFGAVLRYDLNGKLLNIYKKKDGFAADQGIAVDSNGQVYLTEVGTSHVTRFAIPLPVAPPAH